MAWDCSFNLVYDMNSFKNRFFKRSSIKKYIVFAVLGITLFASLMICHDRWKRENRSDHVTLAVSFSEIQEFALQWGKNPFDLLGDLKKEGLDMVLVEEITLQNLQDSSRAAIISGKELVKYNSFFKIPFSFSPDNTYVLCNDSVTSDYIETGLASRFGRSRVARGIFKQGYIIEIAGRDIPFKYIFASGMEKTFDNLILNTPLCVDSSLAEKLKKMGFELVFNFKSSEYTHSSSVNLLFQGIEKFKHAGVVLFSGDRITGYPDYSYKTAQFISRLQRSRKNLRVGIIEFHKPLGLEDIIKEIDPAGFVRVHTITPEEMIKIPFKKAMDRWIRAVRERNLKILFIRPFLNGRSVIGKGYISSPLDLNILYIKNLRQRIIEAGFKPGSPVSHFNSGASRITLFFIALGVTGFALALLRVFIPFSISVFFIALGVFQIPLVLYLSVSEQIVIFRQAYALLAALVFPSLAGIYALRAFSNEWKGVSWSFSSSFWAGFKGAVFVITGIIFITALLYETSFILKIEQFKGVKIAFLIPLGIVCLYFLKSNKIDLSFLNRPLTLLHLLLGFILVGVLGVYILRSGNLPGHLSGATNSGIETSVRDMLEQTLVARPRTKEFLIGYPALFILGFLCSVSSLFKKDLTLIKLFALMGLEILFISTTNTFCHIHSPLRISILRTGNAALIGIPIGIFLIIALHFIVSFIRSRNRVLICGYYGYANIGDEAVLCRIKSIFGKISFENSRANKNYIICYAPSDSLKNGYFGINRFDPFSLLATIAGCKKVILGGGSLIQDTTGLLSPIYYLGIGLLANIFNKDLMLLANGLGPLKNRFIRNFTGLVLKGAKILSFRDPESMELACDLIRETGFTVHEDRLFLVSDPVLNWSFESKKFSKLNSKTEYKITDEYTITVVLRDWPGFEPEKVALSVSNFCDFISKNYKCINIYAIVFKESDVQVSEKFLNHFSQIKRLDSKISVDLFLPENVEEAADLIYRSNIVLAMRLHAAIFAAAAEKPCVTINYDPKVNSFSKMLYNKPGINIEQRFEENCFKSLVESFENTEAIISSIKARKKDLDIQSLEKLLEDFILAIK